MPEPSLEIIDYRLSLLEKQSEKAAADRQEFIRELGKIDGQTEASQMKELLYTEIEENKDQRAQIAVLVEGLETLRKGMAKSDDKNLASAANNFTFVMEGGAGGEGGGGGKGGAATQFDGPVDTANVADQIGDRK